MRSCFDICLTCSLPDCDELGKGCAIRIQAMAYKRACRNGQQPDEVQRRSWCAYCEILKERRVAEREERSAA